MPRPLISINKLERGVEGRLNPRLRVILRAIIALVTNLFLCLVVLASISVVQLILASYLDKGGGKDLVTWTFGFFHYILEGMDLLVLIIFGISGLTTAARILLDHSD